MSYKFVLHLTIIDLEDAITIEFCVRFSFVQTILMEALFAVKLQILSVNKELHYLFKNIQN